MAKYLLSYENKNEFNQEQATGKEITSLSYSGLSMAGKDKMDDTEINITSEFSIAINQKTKFPMSGQPITVTAVINGETQIVSIPDKPVNNFYGDTNKNTDFYQVSPSILIIFWRLNKKYKIFIKFHSQF